MLNLTKWARPDAAQVLEKMSKKPRQDRSPERNRKRLATAIQKAIDNLKADKTNRAPSGKRIGRNLYWNAKDGSGGYGVRLVFNGQELPLLKDGTTRLPVADKNEALNFFADAKREVEAGNADDAIARAAGMATEEAPRRRRRSSGSGSAPKPRTTGRKRSAK